MLWGLKTLLPVIQSAFATGINKQRSPGSCTANWANQLATVTAVSIEVKLFILHNAEVYHGLYELKEAAVVY